MRGVALWSKEEASIVAEQVKRTIMVCLAGHNSLSAVGDDGRSKMWVVVRAMTFQDR
jgi:hypothetical protein